MMKKILFLTLLVCLCFCGTACAQTADEKTAAAMEEFDWVMDEIGSLPGKIDEESVGRSLAPVFCLCGMTRLPL